MDLFWVPTRGPKSSPGSGQDCEDSHKIVQYSQRWRQDDPSYSSERPRRRLRSLLGSSWERPGSSLGLPEVVLGFPRLGNFLELLGVAWKLPGINPGSFLGSSWGLLAQSFLGNRVWLLVLCPWGRIGSFLSSMWGRFVCSLA